MPLLGTLLRRFRAGEHRSPLAHPEYAGKGIGDNVSPPLQWSGVPAPTNQLALVIDDVDVPGTQAANAHHRRYRRA
jgi:phosphatidylethanolamine-binding protein (PEBP) family uncharacterized protein